MLLCRMTSPQGLQLLGSMLSAAFTDRVTAN
jgi:hypothetical protein